MDDRSFRLGDHGRYVPNKRLNKFHITFGVPEHGWLPVKLQLDGELFDFDASDVLNDPVTEIANAAVQLLRGFSRLTTNWWLEPHWNTLLMCASNTQSDLTITLGCLADENQCDPVSEHSVTLDLRGFCCIIHESLQALRGSTTLAEYAADSGWGRPFPQDKLDLMQRLLAEPNGT